MNNIILKKIFFRNFHFLTYYISLEGIRKIRSFPCKSNLHSLQKENHNSKEIFFSDFYVSYVASVKCHIYILFYLKNVSYKIVYKNHMLHLSNVKEIMKFKKKCEIFKN